MKTLSYKNPWGYLVAAGIKDIENRTWKLPEKHKGKRVLIHVSAKPMPGDTFDILGFERWNSLSPDQRILLRSNTLVNSAIIGSVEIVDCVVNHESIWAEKTNMPSGFYMGEPIIYNWVLANPVLFAKPITNVKGKLGFWEYPLTEEEYLDIEKICNSITQNMKCDSCLHFKTYTTGRDEYPGCTVLPYCRKGHWVGWEEPEPIQIDPWANCKDYLQKQ